MTYAKNMLDCVVRTQLMTMLTWYAGIKTNCKTSTGKLGKYLKSQIDPGLYRDLESTFSNAEFENIWQSLFAMGRLFRKAAEFVAAAHGYNYPEQDDARVSGYISHTWRLPQDAAAIF